MYKLKKLTSKQPDNFDKFNLEIAVNLITVGLGILVPKPSTSEKVDYSRDYYE